MSPKVTLSVSKELSEKMEQWKDKFNFSSVFQEAISKEIEKKERFKSTIKEETSMEAIIERLKKEKMKGEEDFHDIGKADGLRWAKNATYQELTYVIKKNEEDEDAFSYDPERDEILGDYFKEIFIEYKNQGIGYDAASYSNCTPNDIFLSWLSGWKEAIEEFWEEIEDKI